MALERELQKREKLLRQLVTLSKAGQGIGMDLIEKLREERNMLPIYRRKVQELQKGIEEKDVEIRDLKHDPQFTRIIELQVEFATWQHEAKRLQGLLQEPSPDVNAGAKSEVEVHARRAEKLEGELQELEAKKAEVAGELAEAESEHEDCLQLYTDRERDLTEAQDATRDLAVSFKKLLQERKHVEQLEEEIEEMSLNARQYEQELALASGPGRASASASSPRQPGRCTLTRAALQSSGAGASASILWAVRACVAELSGRGSLFAHLAACDQDADGLLTTEEFADALARVRCPVPAGEVAAAFFECMAAAAAGGASSLDSAASGSIRWLDFLAVLDQLGRGGGGSAGSLGSSPPLPDLRPLRAACLRTGVDQEDLRRRLRGAGTRAQLEAVLAGLGLGASAVAAWTAVCQARGAQDLLLRLPLGDAAPSASSLAAWRLRCAKAAKVHESELIESFKVWRADMRLTEEQFQIVCGDVIGAHLSEADIHDLALCGGGCSGEIDGQEVLRLALGGGVVS